MSLRSVAGELSARNRPPCPDRAAARSRPPSQAPSGASRPAGVVRFSARGIWAAGAVGKGRLDRGAEQVVGQLLGRRGVRRSLDDRQDVGDEQGAELPFLAIGVDEGDRAAGGELAHRVIRICQAHGDLAGTDSLSDLLVPRQDLHAIGLEIE